LTGHEEGQPTCESRASTIPGVTPLNSVV